MISGRDRTRFCTDGARSRRVADIGRARALQRFHTAQAVIRRIAGMGIESQYDFAVRGLDRRIQTAGDDLSTIGKYTNPFLPPTVLIKYLPRAVVAHSIGDQHFPRHAAHVLSEN